MLGRGWALLTLIVGLERLGPWLGLHVCDKRWKKQVCLQLSAQLPGIPGSWHCPQHQLWLWIR